MQEPNKTSMRRVSVQDPQSQAKDSRHTTVISEASDKPPDPNPRLEIAHRAEPRPSPSRYRARTPSAHWTRVSGPLSPGQGPRTPIPNGLQSLTSDPNLALYLASWRERRCSAQDSAASGNPRVWGFRTWKGTHARGDVQRVSQPRSPAPWSLSPGWSLRSVGGDSRAQHVPRLAARCFGLCSGLCLRDAPCFPLHRFEHPGNQGSSRSLRLGCALCPSSLVLVNSLRSPLHLKAFPDPFPPLKRWTDPGFPFIH